MSDNFYGLIEKSIEFFINHDFNGQAISFSFDIPDTGNQAIIGTEKSAMTNGLYLFCVSALRKGYDMLVSHYRDGKIEEELKKYLKEEYLENTTNIANLQTEIMEVSDVLDDKIEDFF